GRLGGRSRHRERVTSRNAHETGRVAGGRRLPTSDSRGERPKRCRTVRRADEERRSSYQTATFLERFASYAKAASRTQAFSSQASRLFSRRSRFIGPLPWTTFQNSSQSISPKS